MFVAWITTVSIGVIAARFFKPVWSHSFLFGKEMWFQVGKISYLKARKYRCKQDYKPTRYTK